MVRALVEPNVKVIQIVRKVVAREMGGPKAVDRVDVTVEPDSYGDASLSVLVRYRPGASVDAARAARLPLAVRDALWDEGEQRFPYIRHILEDGRTRARA